jgi:hypothetical protein
MKKAIALATGLLMTTSAFAATVSHDENTTLNAGTFASKAAAYDAGFDLTESLQTLTPAKLARELPNTWAYSSVRDVRIDDAKVIVEPVASTRGEIQYRAIVDLDYHFSAHESN